MKLSLVLLLGCTITVFGQRETYSVITFGAINDGHTLSTIPIQKAIDKAAANGGGKVVIPAGYYLTGQLFLRSNVELFLEEKATLLGSTNRLDYDAKSEIAVVEAKNQVNCSITGKGTINGQGRELVIDLYSLLRKGLLNDTDWRLKRPTERNRPGILAFSDCDQIKVTGIILKDASGWVQAYRKCTRVTIDSIRVESTAYWNNDGIDIVDCDHVKITNSFVNTSDDGICLKSENVNSLCQNVEILNCTVRSSASAFKIGTGSIGGFKNIIVNKLTVYDTYRSAIALEAVDGGNLENINIQNVVADYTGNAIFIRLGHRNTSSRYSTLKQVYIANVKVTIPAGKPDVGYPVEGPVLKFQHNNFPSSITGIPGHPVEGVTLENIEIITEGIAKKEVAHIGLDSLAEVSENITGYPEFSMLGELPSWGMYIRHAKDITMKNVKLQCLGDDFRPAMVIDDVNGLRLNGINIPETQDLPVIVLKDVSSQLLQRLLLPADSDKAILIK